MHIFTALLLVVLAVLSAATRQLEPITGGSVASTVVLATVTWTDWRLRR